ncbi:MAG: MoaD/ThiS family protein [Ancrocorticia sp.]|uniref:MoaD/ThiS family protein n=1 Tax=Ancrocorticia sp. TaxID=2593684 RepID=UPI003F928F29
MSSVSLRYFAAVAEAAGTAEESVEVAEGTTAAGLREQLGDLHGEEFARMLGVSALLIDGARADEDAALPVRDGLRVEVLPPFAGG